MEQARNSSILMEYVRWILIFNSRKKVFVLLVVQNEQAEENSATLLPAGEDKCKTG